MKWFVEMNENPYAAPGSHQNSVAYGPVTVEISAEWVRRLHSRTFFVVSVLSGVSISFAPLGLLAIGINRQLNFLTVAGAITCFVVSYFVPLFYFRLAGHVIRQVVNGSPSKVP